MKTLWVFGDSHTEGHGCTPNFEYYQKYYTEGDKTWSEHLAQYLGINLINRGRGGASNDMIMDSIIESFDSIKKGDIVIIGKTYSHRFDVPHIVPLTNTPELNAVFWDWEAFAPDSIMTQFTQREKEIIVDFQYHFMESPLFDMRWNKRYEWVKGILESKGCKVVVWDVKKELVGRETIYQATNRKMKDYHMSFKGHKEFFNYMLTKWIKEKTLL